MAIRTLQTTNSTGMMDQNKVVNSFNKLKCLDIGCIAIWNKDIEKNFWIYFKYFVYA